ncbi:MAG: ribokinase [Candidatus Gallimonas sp.]
MKIFVVGSVNMDLVIRAPYMPENGVTIAGEGFFSNPGGKGANQAVAVAKLGGTSYMVGCVGKEFGEELASALQGYGVCTEFLERREDVSSGIAVIVVVDGDNRIILDEGANGKVDRALVDRALSHAEAGDYLIVQLEIPVPVVEYALARAKELGMVTVLNPAPAKKISAAALKNCDYFTPNRSETEFYTGIRPEDEESVRRCAEKLFASGVKNVVITLGKKGSAYVVDGKFGTQGIFPVETVDTTGAGDTFVGAFVTRLSEGASAAEALRFASKASSLTVTRRGAQQAIPYRREVTLSEE